MFILRFCYNNQIKTNSEDQDKMLQYVAFNQGLLSTQISFFFKFLAVDFGIYRICMRFNM